MNTVGCRALRASIPLLIAVALLLILIVADRSAASKAIVPNANASIVLAAYQAWHGLPSHRMPPPYDSADPATIARHIQAAKAQGIQGFVVDWYGPPAGLPNDADREFIDRATAELFRQSTGQGFQAAIMYDEGTLAVSGMAETTYTDQAIRDLQYAKRYLATPPYLNMRARPAIFVFGYENVEPHIRWPDVRAQLGLDVVLLDKGPDPADAAHDAQYDGHYAWVQPTYPPGWQPDGSEWGEGYLRWFYATMAGPAYASKITVGGVWPGFDDTLAAWGTGRYIARRCGQAWRDTWRLANEAKPPFVLIATWNDTEEGSDTEFGVGECLAPPRQESALPGRSVVYTLLISNTGKFSDQFSLETHSAHGWPALPDPKTISIPEHTAMPISITLSIPPNARGGLEDTLRITAALARDTTIRNTVATTTTVLYGVYLAAIER